MSARPVIGADYVLSRAPAAGLGPTSPGCRAAPARCCRPLRPASARAGWFMAGALLLRELAHHGRLRKVRILQQPG